MPTRTFYLDQELTESISVNWGLNWKNLHVTKEGVLIGQFKDVKELRKGQLFELPDQRKLSVQLKRKLSFAEDLEILVDDMPVPGSSTDPNYQIKQVNYLLLFLAAFNAGLGMLAALLDIQFLLALGLGFGTVIIGIIYAGLWYFVKYKHSVVALYLAVGLMVLDMLATLAFAAEMNSNPFTGLIMKVMFLLLLLKGIPALKKIKADQLALETEIYL